MNRDLDLIAIPWEETLGDVDEMVDKICSLIGGFVLMQNRDVGNLKGDRCSDKPHRRVDLININRDFEMKFTGLISRRKKFANPQYYIDLSVIKP